MKRCSASLVIVVYLLRHVWCFCDPTDCSPPGSCVHGISQARILEWVAMPLQRDLPNTGIKPKSSTLQADSLLSEPPGKLSISKASTSNAGDCRQFRRSGFNPWVRNILWRRKWQLTLVFLPGKSHGQRCLVGYSPWDHKRVRHDGATKKQNDARVYLYLL